MQYETLNHYIDGKWVKPTSGQSQEVMNPAKNTAAGELGYAGRPDLDKAIRRADKGFKTWRKVSAFERGKILRKAADLVRARADDIARVLTLEQGKVLAEAKMEVMSGADIIDWFADEGQRAYGRIIPARADGVRNMVIHGAGRPGRRLLALELPGHAGRAQDRGVAGGRLLDHHQVPGGDAGLADRPRALLP